MNVIVQHMRNGFRLGMQNPTMAEQPTWSKTFLAAFRKGRDHKLKLEHAGVMQAYKKPY